MSAALPLNTETFPDSPVFLRRYFSYCSLFKCHDPATLREYHAILTEYCRYIHFIRKEGIRPSTGDAHRDIDIRNMNIVELDGFTDEEFQQYLTFAETIQKISAMTLRKRISVLKGFYNYLARFADELGLTLPYGNIVAPIQTPTYTARNTQTLTPKQIQALLNVCSGETQLRDQALILTLATTGITISEAAGLDRADAQDDFLYVHGGRNKSRLIYLTPACQKAIDRYLRSANQDLNIVDEAQYKELPLFMAFGTTRRMSHRAIHKRLEVAAQRANLEGIEVSTTTLRNTAALFLMEGGGKDRDAIVVEYLGLSRVSSVQRYRKEELRNALQESRLSQLGE